MRFRVSTLPRQPGDGYELDRYGVVDLSGSVGNVVAECQAEGWAKRIAAALEVTPGDPAPDDDEEPF